MQTKQKRLVLKPRGWRRVVRNIQRFGWEVDSARDLTSVSTTTNYSAKYVSDDTIEVSSHDSNSYHRRIIVDLHRNELEIPGIEKIKQLELLYNVFYIIRKILGPLFPFNLFFFIYALIDSSLLSMTLTFFFLSVMWVISRILEDVISSKAKIILEKGVW